MALGKERRSMGTSECHLNTHCGLINRDRWCFNKVWLEKMSASVEDDASLLDEEEKQEEEDPVSKQPELSNWHTTWRCSKPAHSQSNFSSRLFFLRILRKWSRCWAFLTTAVVLVDQERSSMMCVPRNLKSGCLVSSGDETNHSGVVHKLNNGVLWSGWGTAICVEGIEEGTQYTALWSTSAECESAGEIEPCPLTQDIIGPNLSLLCRIGDGLSHAFIKLDLQNRNLGDIAILSSFVHLRFLDISSNYLTDLSPLAALTELLWLKADANRVQSVRGQPLSQLPYLQWLNLMSNRLNEMEGLDGPALESLNLTGNAIQMVSGLDYEKLTNLVSLELRENHLETTDGIYLPNLRRLYLAQNKIKRLEGLEKLEHLIILHLRDNQLETLDGLSPSMKSLQYLNVRGNLVSSQDALQSLMGVGHTLRTLVLANNPLAETDDYRLIVISRLPRLERLDKAPISPVEQIEAEERLRELQNFTEQEET
ncbi:leucine-rich repeat-containing protein 23 [Neoarius graeffei]|uniref:leucine-rich repeat-containing protein 23 n=1 Tax=Neoarius graeffei TaxID=443677 RepID=UPI00298C0F71|nr:leucine-rich repeat-containing protein 23 [Neoarius graeffei]